MKIPDRGRVARYCPPGKNNRGRPTLAAFLLKREKDEEYLSANWLRAERQLGIERSLDLVRKTFKDKGYVLRENGRFAVLNVGSIRGLGHALWAEHRPTDDDPCHSGICGSHGLSIEREREIATDLKDLLSDQDVYPAIITDG